MNTLFDLDGTLLDHESASRTAARVFSSAPLADKPAPAGFRPSVYELLNRCSEPEQKDQS